MMITAKDWTRFVDRLSEISRRAAADLRTWVSARGGLINVDRDALIRYAYALAVKYGEGTSSLAAVWYDTVAEASGKFLPAAEPAAVAAYEDVAKAINGVLDVSSNENMLAGAMERLAKLPGVDTTVKNAIRDGAEVAWVPHGDTCAFCIALASRGWERASRRLVSNGHAAHVHANCDCTYAVRFSESTEVAGYDPAAYRAVYDSAPGHSSQAKINAMRREFYAQNREEIRAQQSSAYAQRRELESSAAEEADV